MLPGKLPVGMIGVPLGVPREEEEQLMEWQPLVNGLQEKQIFNDDTLKVKNKIWEKLQGYSNVFQM